MQFLMCYKTQKEYVKVMLHNFLCLLYFIPLPKHPYIIQVIRAGAAAERKQLNLISSQNTSNYHNLTNSTNVDHAFDKKFRTSQITERISEIYLIITTGFKITQYI